MLDKLTDAANILIAKVSKDELEQKLVLATSEQNWQTPTNILHEIANAAYNYEKWQKINDFIWDKLKKKSTWRKIIKTLNLVQFLIKNGSPSAIKSFKYDVYQFKSFSDYQATSQGIDRGQAIREKAKQIVQLLSNDQHLQEERQKAKKIREKMSGVTGAGNYGSYQGGGEKYGNYNNKSYSEKSNSSNSNYNYGNSDQGGLGVYGNYTTGKSTLDKYKSDKDKSAANSYKPATNIPDITGFGGSTTTNTITGQGASIVQEQAPKKPFEKTAPKLGKPSQVKKQQPKSIIPPTSNPSSTTKANILDMDDIFSAGATSTPTPTSTNTSTANSVAAGSTNTNSQLQAQQEQMKLMQQQMLLKQQQLLLQQQQQQQQLLIQQQNALNFNPFGQTAPLSQPQPYPNPYAQNYGQPYGVNNQLYGGLTLNPPAQTFSFGTPSYPQAPTTPVYPTYTPSVAPPAPTFNFTPPVTTNQITLSENTKKDDDFGSFQSAPSQSTANVKWLNNHEKGLIDFTDFNSEIKTSQDIEPAKPKADKGNNIKINAWDW